jgi:hypothetical protein
MSTREKLINDLAKWIIINIDRFNEWLTNNDHLTGRKVMVDDNNHYSYEYIIRLLTSPKRDNRILDYITIKADVVGGEEITIKRKDLSSNKDLLYKLDWEINRRLIILRERKEDSKLYRELKALRDIVGS